MPYISQGLRESLTGLDSSIKDLVLRIKYRPSEELNGILNYTITEIICQVLKTKYGPDWRYNGINDAVGVLECAKMEYYRRLAGPYEDKAIAKNGDIDSYKNLS